MTEDQEKRFRKAADQIDLNLTGLLGSLGEAIGEAVARLDQVSDRDQGFEMTKSPMRAKAGLRVRIGGLAGNAAPQPRPVNPGRKPAAAAPAKPKQTKTLVLELLEDMGEWIVFAELPGVAISDLSFALEEGDLVVRTSGDPIYLGRINLPFDCQTDQIKAVVKNGILTLQFAGKVPE